MKRYIVNSATSQIHDSRTLSEKCNTDDIKEMNKDRVGLAEMLELIRKAGYDLCENCFEEE